MLTFVSSCALRRRWKVTVAVSVVFEVRWPWRTQKNSMIQSYSI